MKIAITILAALFLISSCATYVWGNKWELEGGNTWQTLKEERSRADPQNGDLKVARCNNQELYLGANQVKSGSAVAPLLIPVAFSENEDAKKSPTLQIFLKYPHVKTLCTEYKDEVISMSYADNVLSDVEVKPGIGFQVLSTNEGEHFCSIIVDASVAEDNDIVLSLNKDAFGCQLPPITISKTQYSCIKEAKWGGTDCGVE